MVKHWHLASFNPSFSRKVEAFFQKNKIKTNPLRDQTYLLYCEEKLLATRKIAPFLITAQQVKKFQNESKIKEYIQKKSAQGKKYALRAWILDHSQNSGRDIEVKLGKAIEKKGVIMDPHNEENIWFILKRENEWFIPPRALSVESHPFPLIDYRIIEKGFVTRSGQKLKFLLHHFQLDPKNKIGVDLGSGKGGWTELLIQKGAKKIYAIDKTKLDKKIQKNKKVIYFHQKAEETPKLKEKPNFIVMDINVNPEHAKKIFTQFDKKNPGATHAIITQKIVRGKDLDKLPKKGDTWGKWKLLNVRNSWFARRECYAGLVKSKKITETQI
ncbi:MAG: SAM-dependent methyltransferase [Candidatus Diapherotrites archaeon]